MNCSTQYNHLQQIYFQGSGSQGMTQKLMPTPTTMPLQSNNQIFFQKHFGGLFKYESPEKEKGNVCKNTDVPKYTTKYPIFQLLMKKEKLYQPNCNYMKQQPELTPNKRMILVDWLMECNRMFDHHQETMFLTVQILDRFLSKTFVKMEDLQLIGMVSLLLASKYSEIFAPEVDELLAICVKCGYTKDMILETERTILECLDFRLTTVTPFLFLYRYYKGFEDRKMDKNVFEIVKNTVSYLTEVCLLDYKLLAFPPSSITASCAFLAGKFICGKNFQWSQSFEGYSGYREQQIVPVIKVIMQTLRRLCIDDSVITPKKSKLKTRRMLTVKKKYSTDEMLRTSSIVEKVLKKLR